MYMKTINLSLVVFLMIIININYGQTTKINFKSKKSKGITVNQKSLLILWDKVIFTNNKSIMYCDSATYNRSNNSFIAYRNIRINENDSLELFGDSLHYFGDRQEAFIYGNVELNTNDINLTAPSLIFNQKEKIAEYSEGAIINDKKEGYTIKSKKGTLKTKISTIYFKENVILNHPEYNITSDTLIYNTNFQNTTIIGKTKISSKNSVINCQKGWFNNRTKKSSLKGNIFIESNNHTFFADSIFYNEISGLSYAKGNVKIIDDSSNIMIEGNYGYHSENIDSSHIWSNSILTQSDSTDTLKIYADQFIRKKDTLKEEIFCFNNVIIDGTQIQGDCDSIYFNETDSIMKCIIQPIIWLDSTQVTGDKVEFKIHKGIVYKMDIENNAIIITKKDSVHYDQIKGNTIYGFFKENKINLMDINGNGEVIYYSENESDSTITELNKIKCEKMKIFLNKNKISSINFFSNPSGNTQPIKENDKGLFFDDFHIFLRRSYLEKYNEAKGDLLNGK